MYHYFPAQDAPILTSVLVFYGLLCFIYAVGYLISYIIRSVGLYTLAKNRHFSAPLLAWIPFVRTYINGQLAGEIVFGKKTMRHPGLWLLFLPAALSFILAIIVAGYMVSSVFTAFSVSALSEAHISSVLFPVLIVWVLILAVVSLVQFVLQSWIIIIVHFNIYKKYRLNSMALTHAIFSAFIPFYRSVFLFRLGKKESAIPAESDCPPVMPEQE